MNDINFIEGSLVRFRGENWRIYRTVNLDLVELQSADGVTRKLAAIRDLEATKPSSVLPVQSSLRFDDPQQHEAALRIMECIRPLVDARGRTKQMVAERARQFDMSVATAYRRIDDWEQYGRLEALIKRTSSGGRGKSRLVPEVEAIVQDAVPTYLTQQKLTIGDIETTVRQVCELRGLPAPHLNTIGHRIRQHDRQTTVRKRMGRKAAMKYEQHADLFDRATYPLALVQIDHTVLDVTLVDDELRLPIGRDVWITLAFDVFSRMVVGYYISLDPVGEISTGMCIAHAIMKKEHWLREHGIETEWPCWGPMDCIHADNALEFRSKMLRRACSRYGIGTDFRPVARPHFGGHIERFFGTLSKQLHKLPGTTFSNIVQKAEYDSEGKACFTFDELDRFIAKWIVEVYHHTYHRGIRTTPIQKYRSGFSGPTGLRPPRIIGDVDRLQRDFMPYKERTVQRAGVEIDHVHYSGPELAKWIGSQDEKTNKPRKFLFARDPRDISHIFFFDPDKGDYLAIFRTDNAKTSASIWEWRRAYRELEREGRKHVNEPLLLAKVVELRELALLSQKKTKAKLREVQKLKHHQKLRKKAQSDPRLLMAESKAKESELSFTRPIRPFDNSPVVLKEIIKL